MEVRRISEDDVTETAFPARKGAYAESRGSAFWRRGTISEGELESKDFDLFVANRLR